MIFNKEGKNHEKNKVCIQSISKGDNSRWTDGRTAGRSGTFTLPLMAIYQCIKFHLIPFYTFIGYASDKLFIAKIKKESNSINTGDRVMVLAFCNSLHGPLSVYQVSFIYLQYF